MRYESMPAVGDVLSLEPSLAKNTYHGIDLDSCWFVQYGITTQPYEFTKGSIFHLMEPALNHEIYGLPEYSPPFPPPCLTSPPRCSVASITSAAAMLGSSLLRTKRTWTISTKQWKAPKDRANYAACLYSCPMGKRTAYGSPCFQKLR